LSLDYHISFLEKSFRRERGSPRYFSDPISSMFPSSRPQEVDQAKTDREKVAKEQPEKQRKEVQQQQKQSTQSQQAQNLNQLPRGDMAAEAREGQGQQHTEGQALKEASKQGVQELRHSEFAQPQPQQVHTGSAFRAPSSTGGSVLQNIRVLTGEAHPEQTPLMGRGEGNAAPTARDTGSHATTPDTKGVRLSDIARFAGIQEHGHMPTGASSDPRALRAPFGRAGTPHAQPFTPQSPFSRLADRAFARTWSPDQLTTLLNQAAKTLPESNAALSNRTTNVAVVMHGSLVFVRDGDRVRSFRLLDDGTLYETTHDGEHGGEVPLSKEARGELTRLLKQKGLHARLHGEKEALTETQGEGKPHLMKDRSLSARGELRSLARDDSTFAHLLREVLEEGGVVAQYLNEGEDAQFPEKSDWVGFFGRMLGLGSEEKSVKKKFDEIMGFMFRGLFKKGESKQTLVSDIKYESSGKTWEAKFAQIGIDDEQLLELLKSLKPGQSISKEMLQKYLGEEVSFIQLLHVIQKSDPILAGEIMKAIKFDPSASVDPFSQARLEHHIFSQSRRKPSSFGVPGGGLGDNGPANGTVFANVYDLQPKPKEEVHGKPKIYTVIAYASIVFGLILLLFFLFGK
jgi:hypothetical protein